ncbi:XK-related protein 9 [Kryptolebias marmoratus]|uniref:XK-related protein n=1 Tax=Kryptolebias marmoratus TaxID=37003 RepID=A0A3Q3F8D2_KRYMA|nr:XK-related protein 9 [Kryptolebias marmoratus]
MEQSDTRFSKLRWLLAVGGLVLYVVDTGTDVALVVGYFLDKQYTWSGLTVMFILTGMLVTQIFSYAWFRDDMKNGEQITAGMSKSKSAALHVFGMGIFTRYYHLLKEGSRVVWTTEDSSEKHHRLFCMASDLSMLKLFETFLESAPQILLQLYIQGSKEWPLFKIISVAFSFCNMAWSLVDYRCCLRKSLPHITDMPSGLPTAVYLLYKLGTITSLILSYSLLLTLSIYSTIAFTLFWLLATTWAHWLQTDFCSARVLELLYRAVVGVVLIFSFFNVKGKNTKEAMIIYYVFYGVISVTAPLSLALLKPELQKTVYFWTVCGLIYGGLLVGLLCLVLYYRFLHPRAPEADEVDGLKTETVTPERLKTFMQP